MIFHQINGWSNLASCQKRAIKFGRERPKGFVYKLKRMFFKDRYLDHPLAILWENIKFFYIPKDYLYNWVMLDYFALRVDEHLKTNMLKSDIYLQYMLKEWLDMLDIDAIYANELIKKETI